MSVSQPPSAALYATTRGRRRNFEFTAGVGHGHLDHDADTALLSIHSSLFNRGRSHSRSRSRGRSSGRNRGGKSRNRQGMSCKHEWDPCTSMPNSTASNDPETTPTNSDIPSLTSSDDGPGTLSTTGMEPTTETTFNDQPTTSTDSNITHSAVGSVVSTPLSNSVPETTSSSSSLPPTETGETSPRPQSTLSNRTGAIVGGVLGGLIFLLLLILSAILFLRRRKRKRTPASAEFRNRYIPHSTPRLPLATQTSQDNLYLGMNTEGSDSADPPPPFERGNFNDPLFEKIYETRRAHVEYGLAS